MNYILGENAARKLRGIFTAGNAAPGERTPAHITAETEIPPPFTVRYSSHVAKLDTDPVENPPKHLGWIVQMPMTSYMVYYNGEATDFFVGSRDKEDGGNRPLHYAENWCTIGLEETRESDWINMILFVEDPDAEEPPQSGPYGQLYFGEGDEPLSGMRKITIPVAHVYITDEGEVGIEQIVCGPIYYSDGGGEVESTPGCFDIDNITVGTYDVTISFLRHYYQIGGKIYDVSTMGSISIRASDWVDNGIVAIKANASGSMESAQLAYYPTLEALQTAQEDLNFYVDPLYMFDLRGKVVVDFRNRPVLAMGEF